MYSLVSLSIFFILLTNVPSDGEQILRKVAIPAPFPFMRGHSVMTFVPANGTYRMSSAEFARGARNKGSYVRVEGEDGEILRISCNIRFPTQRRLIYNRRGRVIGRSRRRTCASGIFYFGYDWARRLRGAYRYCGKKYPLNFQSREFVENRPIFAIATQPSPRGHVGSYKCTLVSFARPRLQPPDRRPENPVKNPENEDDDRKDDGKDDGNDDDQE